MRIKISSTTTSTNRSSSRPGFLLITLVLACFAFSPQARAVCQEGCDLTYDNTFLGADALINNTTGYDNTAIGRWALYSNTSGTANRTFSASSRTSRSKLKRLLLGGESQRPIGAEQNCAANGS